MDLYGLIGHPLEHSFSKTYFNRKFESERLDCHYMNFDLEDLSELPSLLQTHPNLKGLNVTSPYKEKIIPYLHECDKIISDIKAVNTIKISNHNKLIGFNTDILGFNIVINDLVKLKRIIIHNALVLGTGGASKAVQWVLRHQGIPFQVVSRDPSRGDLTYRQLTPKTVKDHTLIINATPVGLSPNVDEAPDIPYEAITEDHCLIDLIYNPEETLFLKYGKERGATITNGLAMLHAQAEASWKIWNTSPPAPLPRERGEPTGGIPLTSNL